ncbi:MAG: sulfotransferase [Rhodanobacteraceae bacterium]
MTSHRADRLWRRFNQYMQNAQSAAARATLESLVLLTPNDPRARIEQAKLILNSGQVRAATTALLEIVPLLPAEDAGQHCELAQLLISVGEVLTARQCLDQAESISSPSAAALVRLAHARHSLGELRKALELMERAIAAGADSPYDHHFHGMLLQFVGRITEAREILDSCVHRWPAFGSAALTLARLQRQTAESQHLDYLRDQLEHVPPNTLDHASFEFALFKELDDLGRYDEAWPALGRANAIMHARNPYDEEGDERVINETIRVCGHEALGTADTCDDFDGPVPIFIVGPPRSGTTLLDRMLGNHPAITSAGELGDFLHQWRWMANLAGARPQDFIDGLRRTNDFDFRQLGARYLKQTQWRANGSPYFIDKMPNNLTLIGFIKRALPHAKILCMTRDPMAVCFSNFKAMFGDRSAHSYDLQLLGRFHQLLTRIHDHWQTTMPGAVLDVPYAALVKKPEAVIRQVLEFCGLEFAPECLDPTRNAAPVSTPSSAQVREAIHGRGVDEWRHYEAHLAPLKVSLG